MSVIRKNPNTGIDRNRFKNPPVSSVDQGVMPDQFPETNGNSPYEQAKRIFSSLDDRSWLDRLNAIHNSYVEPPYSIFDALGISQNYNKSRQAQEMAIRKEIANLLAEYHKYTNSLPVNQVAQHEAAGLNPAITGGIGSSELDGNQTGVPDPMSAPYESPMSTMASIVGGFTDVFNASSSILSLVQQSKGLALSAEQLAENKRQFNLNFAGSMLGLALQDRELGQGDEKIAVQKSLAALEKSKFDYDKSHRLAHIQTAFAEAGMQVPDSLESVVGILAASKNKSLAAAKVSAALSEANVQEFEAGVTEDYIMTHQQDLAEAIEDIARLAYMDKLMAVSASISSSRYSMDSDKTNIGENKIIRASQKGREVDAEYYSSYEAQTLRKMLVRAGLHSDISSNELAKLRDDAYNEAMSKWQKKSRRGNPFASWMYSKFLFGEEPWSAAVDAAKDIAVGAGAAAAGMGIGSGGAAAAGIGSAARGYTVSSTLF